MYWQDCRKRYVGQSASHKKTGIFSVAYVWRSTWYESFLVRTSNSRRTSNESAWSKTYKVSFYHWGNLYTLVTASLNTFISPHVRYWFPENVCLRTPESRALKSGIHLKDFGIPRTVEIWYPSCTDKESGTQYLVSGIHSVETIQEYFLTYEDS